MFELDGRRVTLAQLTEVAQGKTEVTISAAARERVGLSRRTLERFVEEGRVIYGVNTGVGGFVDWLVPTRLAGPLQENLINAVATNVGEHLDDSTVRAIMLARIVSLARGNSAISVRNLDTLVAMFNAGIVPCVPAKGSLGTSGDLGPLAAVALVGVGQWRARLGGRVLPGARALEEAGITPMELGFKEGLALVNGTSGMVGLGALAVRGATHLLDAHLLVSALSVEGLAGLTKPFDPRVHRLKPHRGQYEIAACLWDTLLDSGLAVREEARQAELSGQVGAGPHTGTHPVEDAYSIRCTPQVLGPVLDALRTVAGVVENELNSSNDNPLVVPEEDECFHSGHFHGQYVAMAMDQLAIALTTMTNLSNRRVDRFLDASHSNGLPPFLCGADPGVRLGLMGGQFMTASLTAENRALTVPVSVHSLSSTADFQDVVSLGFVAARRANEILDNARYVIAFELLCACQAVDLRGAGGLSTATRRLYERTRAAVPFLDHDVTLTDHLETIARTILTPGPERSEEWTGVLRPDAAHEETAR
ncbi:phenylalanine aminomutase (D-beta-phenylalanine forming) [Streptomyces niveiscabiei]|uniref:phenylalanine aminomutase (D-beta-phenylalanine forming) n=1 Tax=Streptomyces niveiscabiei TaxID=164115 RepID=UPI0006EB8986|nr:phenylalanine aminomutase (D-beta-phenylalanine forming) [Streptomyces niveiscabiei]